MWFRDPLTAKSPSICKAALRVLFSRLLGKVPAVRIDWREPLHDMLARFIVGLFVGAVFAFFLFPIAYWPGRRGRPSLYDSLDQPGWFRYIFAAAWLGTAIVIALRTKARLYYRDEDRTDPPVF